MHIWGVSTFWLCEKCCCKQRCTWIYLSSCFSTGGPSFLLQISQLHPEIVSSKTSIIRNLSWPTAWVWVLLQSPVWFQIYALFFCAGSVCMELHFPDSLALWLSGSFSQCEALEGDWGTEEGEDSIFLLLSLHFWGHIGQWLHLLLAPAPTRKAHWGSKICQANLTSCYVPPAPGMVEASYCCCSLDYSICALWLFNSSFTCAANSCH